MLKFTKEQVLQKEFLEQCFECDFENGTLYHKIKPHWYFKNNAIAYAINNRYKGLMAGSISKKTKRSNTEYMVIKVANISEKVHRIIWILRNGTIPDGMHIDHIDNNGLNNSISNLRIVTQSKNQRNKLLQKSNITGVNGVNWHKSAKQWQARITDNNGNRIDLGRFSNFDEAVNVRKSFEIEYGYLK